jgi:ComF family protein
VGQRRDVLQRLIGLYKFERTRSAYKELGYLLMKTIPELPLDAIIVPVPTTRRHVRERGYDHTVLLARYIARQRHLTFSQPLVRVTATMQRHSSASERDKQAKMAFGIRGEIVNNVPYILIDDVVTTGATIKYAAQALLDAGVAQVWVAVIARQTLD